MITYDDIVSKSIVPVIKIEDIESAVPLAHALVKGGLPVAEITFRTDVAGDAIAAIRESVPGMIVGAGTILTAEQAKEAIDKGAQFVVSPGISRPVIEYCLDKNVPIIPGTCTPSDLMVVSEYGLNIAKFFPAGNYGGLKTLKSLAAVFSSINFMPTGGIKPDNLAEYLEFDRIAACGGTWLTPEASMKQGRFDDIERLVREALAIVASVRG
ncbi:bifunctional 4-hydroxy-2-oxoglutarate aldolase/2-dehydro-3-deoxy-phosphogluconate aldolase [Arcanobacterium haemolyticum]|nr:bifunctional 4-hydroxy-2-oxoglutarate aldolase/2-dehydro-3-deoxy-phosphogluconate aldolase [Arcanobacterium haemolyticum]